MQGFVQVYTGDGKGKTTAALGLALRAAGAGLRVYFGQFIKNADYSEIKALAREAGFRTKIAVQSHDPNVSAKGACIGPMGQRVRAVMNELGGEKIDIIDWSEDGAQFVAEALSPAKVSSVTVTDQFAKAARAIVPDYQLSLAIGREGQNARLAARLTGWRIDIRPDTQA